MDICQPSAMVFRPHGLIKQVYANCATTGRPSSSWRRLPRVWHACMPLLRDHERLQAAGTLHKTHGRGGHTRKSHRALHPANEKEPLQTNGQPCGHQDKASNRIYCGSATKRMLAGARVSGTSRNDIVGARKGHPIAKLALTCISHPHVSTGQRARCRDPGTPPKHASGINTRWP